MKKINEKHSEKDRIICISSDKHQFYYQPAGTNDRFWLLDVPSYSHSVFTYFLNRGRRDREQEFSLTIGELYRFRDFHNIKLAHILERIPGLVDYVIRNELSRAEPVELVCAPDSLPPRKVRGGGGRDHAA